MAESTRQGPATFAIEADQAVQSAALPAQSAQPAAQAAPIAPGLTTQAPGVSDVGAKTFKAISDLSSGVLAPKIKEAAQAQFVGGVQRAMTGEALSEIIKDQPWYSDIFAPSSALAGARTYTAQSAVAQWAGKMQEQMPQLAKVGPEQLRDAATGTLQGFMTGDTATDSMMTSAVVEQMAPLFKQHAKEHYVYVQKQATMAQIGSWEAAGKVYQGFAATAASGSGTVSPEDAQAAKARLLGSVMPFADQSDESFARNIGAFLEASASAGNFQVVKLFKDSGLYAKIPDEKRADLDRTMHVFAKNALDQVRPQYALEQAMIVNDTNQNPKDIVARLTALNDKVAAATGITEAEFIPKGTFDNIIGHVLVAQEADARRAAKVPPEDQGPAIALSLINGGNGAVDKGVKLGLVKESDVERAGLSLWNEAKTPSDRAKVLNSRTLAAFDAVKSTFVNTLRADEYNAGVGDMAQVYQGVAENVKPLYFNEQERQLMDRFNAQVRGGTPPQAAWATVRTAQDVGRNMLPKDPKDEVTKAIRSYVEGENETWYHRNTVDDSALRTIEAMTHKSFKSDRTNNTLDVAVARSYAEAKSNGLDIQGKHAIINQRPTDRPLYSLIGEGQRDTAQAFEELMKEKAASLGSSLDNYLAVRTPDVGKQAHIYVEATAADGHTVTWGINSDELKGRAGQIAAKARGSKAIGVELDPNFIAQP